MFSSREIDALSEEKQKKLLKYIEEKGPEYGVYPLTAEQKRMWFLYLIDTKSTSYNGMCVFEFEGDIKEQAVNSAINKIILRHSIFRTTYIDLMGLVYQVVNDTFEYKMEKFDLSSIQNDHLKQEKYAEIIRRETEVSFNLKDEIPIKFLFIKMNKEKTILILKLHHICFDGWSLGIFVREFYELYESYCTGRQSILLDVSYQYSDYALWQQKQIEKHAFDKKIEYWKTKLQHSEKNIIFNYEKKNLENNNLSFKGSAIEAWIGKEELELLQITAAEYKTSVFVVALSIFYIILAQNTNQTNINVGTPVLNRQKQEHENIIGFFANTLVLNADVEKDISFAELLKRVKETVVEAMDKQDVPFDLVVDYLNIERTVDMSPLFKVMFSLRSKMLVSGDLAKTKDLDKVSIQFHTLEDEYIEYVQYKMMFTLTQYEDGMSISVGYNSDILEKQYMELFILEYIDIVRKLNTDLDISISDLESVADSSNICTGEKYVLNNKQNLLMPGIVGNVYCYDNQMKTWLKTRMRGYNTYDSTVCIMDSKEKKVDSLEEQVVYINKVETNARLVEVQMDIMAIWSEIISNKEICITDKFFEVGGNSIMSIQAIAMMNKKFGTNLEIVDLFKYKTVKELSQYIVSLEETDVEKDNDKDIIGLTF